MLRLYIISLFFLLCYHGIGNTMSEQSPQWVWGKLESEFWPKRWLLSLTLLTSKSTVNANVSKECWALKAVDVWILPLIRTHNKKKEVRFFFLLLCRRCSTHISFSPLRYVLIKVLISGWIFLLRKYLFCVMFPPALPHGPTDPTAANWLKNRQLRSWGTKKRHWFISSF